MKPNLQSVRDRARQFIITLQNVLLTGESEDILNDNLTTITTGSAVAA